MEWYDFVIYTLFVVALGRIFWLEKAKNFMDNKVLPALVLEIGTERKMREEVETELARAKDGITRRG